MGLSVWHVILVLAVVLILFGAGKLPRVMGDLAKSIKNFKSGLGGESETPPPPPPPVTQSRPAESETKTDKDPANKA